MASHQLQPSISKNFITNYFWKVIDLLAYSFDVFARNYYEKSIGGEYRKEYIKYKITSNDKILHIGCGMFPLTELTLAEDTNATIIGIDKDRNIINKATKSINHRGLNEHIQIIHGAGEQYPSTSFSVIIISSCATPKISIINHMLKDIRSGTKIIIREVESLAPSLFEQIEKQNDLSFVDSMSHNPFPFYTPFGWKSRCYVKN